MKDLTSTIARILRREITDQDRDDAIDAARAFLVKIDVKKVDLLRRQLELPPEAIGFLVEIYAGLLAEPKHAKHED
jgi:hypothetical protein